MLKPHGSVVFQCLFPSLDCPSCSTVLSSVLILSSAFLSSEGALRKKPDRSFILKLHGVNLNQ